MKYDIYFHDDFDGRASAAVMLSFLRSRGDDIEHYVPVNFDLKPQWSKKSFFKKHKLFKGKRNPAIVVDFLYHPKAAWWFDHHATTFQDPNWKEKFRPSKFYNCNPKYFSCCHQVLDALVRDFGFRAPKHLKNLALWLDITDAARYKSIKQAVEIREPALQISAFINKFGDRDAPLVWLIDLLSRKPFSRILSDPRVARKMQLIKKERKEVLVFYRKNVQLYGRIVVIDVSDVRKKEIRHAPYYLYPKVIYSLSFKEDIDGLYHISLGVNPARRSQNKVNIGEFLRKNYGGGGHKNVGGAEFGNKQKTERAVKEIVGKFK